MDVEPQEEAQEAVITIPFEAYLPENYIESEHTRIEIYKRIAAVKTEDDAKDVLDEMTDRFGKPPQVAKNLLYIALIRAYATALGATEVRRNEVGFLLKGAQSYLLKPPKELAKDKEIPYLLNRLAAMKSAR